MKTNDPPQKDIATYLQEFLLELLKQTGDEQRLHEFLDVVKPWVSPTVYPDPTPFTNRVLAAGAIWCLSLVQLELNYGKHWTQHHVSQHSGVSTPSISHAAHFIKGRIHKSGEVKGFKGVSQAKPRAQNHLITKRIKQTTRIKDYSDDDLLSMVHGAFTPIRLRPLPDGVEDSIIADVMQVLRSDAYAEVQDAESVAGDVPALIVFKHWKLGIPVRLPKRFWCRRTVTLERVMIRETDYVATPVDVMVDAMLSILYPEISTEVHDYFRWYVLSCFPEKIPHSILKDWDVQTIVSAVLYILTSRSQKDLSILCGIPVTNTTRCRNAIDKSEKFAFGTRNRTYHDPSKYGMLDSIGMDIIKKRYSRPHEQNIPAIDMVMGCLADMESAHRFGFDIEWDKEVLGETTIENLIDTLVSVAYEYGKPNDDQNIGGTSD